MNEMRPGSAVASGTGEKGRDQPGMAGRTGVVLAAYAASVLVEEPELFPGDCRNRLATIELAAGLPPVLEEGHRLLPEIGGGCILCLTRDSCAAGVLLLLLADILPELNRAEERRPASLWPRVIV